MSPYIIEYKCNMLKNNGWINIHILNHMKVQIKLTIKVKLGLNCIKKMLLIMEISKNINYFLINIYYP